VASEENALVARVIVLENVVDRVEKSVTDLARVVQKSVEAQASAPRQIPFKEIIITAAATLSLFGGILTFLDSRSAKDFDLMKEKMSFIAYRLEKIEHK